MLGGPPQVRRERFLTTRGPRAARPRRPRSGGGPGPRARASGRCTEGARSLGCCPSGRCRRNAGPPAPPRSRQARPGTQGDDVICGLGGEDLIKGRRGNDVLRGGRGNDRLRGGIGEDTLRGGADDDELRGQAGDDRLFGGSGGDLLGSFGEWGADRLVGGPGWDVVIAGSGPDAALGGAGSDCLDGHDSVSGNDAVSGGPAPEVQGDSGAAEACVWSAARLRGRFADGRVARSSPAGRLPRW